MEKTYHFKITKDKMRIDIPYTIAGHQMRINWVRYRTANANQKVLHLKINGFDHNFYSSDTTLMKYTKAIMLPSKTNEDILYINQSSFFDVVSNCLSNCGTNTITIETYIDTVAAGAFVSISNPLQFEITVC